MMLLLLLNIIRVVCCDDSKKFKNTVFNKDDEITISLITDDWKCHGRKLFGRSVCIVLRVDSNWHHNSIVLRIII